MTLRRKSVQLDAHDRPLLVEQYLRWRIPVDQFEKRPDDLRRFVEEWHQTSARKDTGEELIHYMRTQRKRNKWVTFDGAHDTAPPLPKLTAEETEILVRIYTENVINMDCGSDVLAYEAEVAALIAKEFSLATNRVVPAHQLVAKLTALRKRGRLPKVGNKEREDKTIEGFTDINEVPKPLAE